MTIEETIRKSLLAFEEAIESGDGALLRQSMAEVDTALAEHRQELDGQLKHYLKNRSYMKALAYLQGEADIPKGRCGGRKDFS